MVVKEGKHITAGNASQLSDGASAQVLMDRATAEAEGKQILGIFRGFQSVGCAPEEMGIGPVLAVPKLLDRAGLKVGDKVKFMAENANGQMLVTGIETTK